MPYPSVTSRIIISTKPIANAIVPQLLCAPSDISGINSSTTTYIIAPAANASIYGMTGTITPAARIVSHAATGSTAPDSTPYQNVLPFAMPSARSGIDTMAPPESSESQCRAPAPRRPHG